jgi:hypothetical protein
MKQPDEKIARAVATCLAFAAESKSPFLQLDDLLALLKVSTGWTDEELDQVRSRVQGSLLQAKIVCDSPDEN